MCARWHDVWGNIWKPDQFETTDLDYGVVWHHKGTNGMFLHSSTRLAATFQNGRQSTIRCLNHLIEALEETGREAEQRQ